MKQCWTSLQIEGILDHFELYRDEGPSKGGPFGPYVQSHRLNTYVEAAERLIDAGHAYRCFCSQEVSLLQAPSSPETRYSSAVPL
uniref:tRNA-synt_1c domain-containing protein n=1 Tax=Ascaris lumbricoides TaxID=6252 RepID=A0A0M3HMC7_ASCLU